MKHLEALKELLSKKKSTVILPHTKPDADALGSCLALAGVMNKCGHEAKVISPTDYPVFLNWMKGQDEVIKYNSKNHEEIESIIASADLIFCLDFCSLKRIDELGPMVGKSKADKVLIDHHIGKEDFAKYEYWEKTASSTAELIYEFIHLMDLDKCLDKELAEAIYAGMMTDTGSFRFPSTSRRVHEIIAELMDLNIEHSKVHRRVYDNNRIDKVKLLGYALSEKLVLLEGLNTAYISLSEDELNRYDYKTGDSEGLVNYALSLKGVVFAALIIEKDNAVKFSFRSVGDFDVNEFAKANFNGGGHKNAAGGKLDVTFQEAVSKFTQEVPKHKEYLIKQSELENTIC